MEHDKTGNDSRSNAVVDLFTLLLLILFSKESLLRWGNNWISHFHRPTVAPPSLIRFLSCVVCLDDDVPHPLVP
jgi:hypothetical protein